MSFLLVQMTFKGHFSNWKPVHGEYAKQHDPQNSTWHSKPITI